MIVLVDQEGAKAIQTLCDWAFRHTGLNGNKLINEVLNNLRPVNIPQVEKKDVAKGPELRPLVTNESDSVREESDIEVEEDKN